MSNFNRLPYISFFISLLLIRLSGLAQQANQAEIPKGRIETFKFKESKIFPGTERTVEVYIPKQIDPAKPACVFVHQDGFAGALQISVEVKCRS